MERTFEQSKANFISKVMMYMGTGLLLTFFVAFYTATDEGMRNLIFGSSMTIIFLVIVELGLVMYLSRNIENLSLTNAKIAFYIYAAVNGLTISYIFLLYPMSSILNVFLIASGMFLTLGFIGMTIKRDLSGMSQFFALALIGIIIASIVNIFLGSQGLGFIISILGIILFSGLTVYDMQKIKEIHSSAYNMDEEMAGKYSIIGALALYLDFINIFLYLLRLFGNRD